MAQMTRYREPRGIRTLMRTLDPERMMRELFQTDPFAAMEPVVQQLQQAERWFSPNIDVKENKDAFVFNVDLPGVNEGDIEVTVSGRTLTISGRREEEKRDEQEGGRVYEYEREYGIFSRSFTLPETADLDRIQAELQNGVLRIVVPKKASEQPKKIEVQGQQRALGQGGEEGQAKKIEPTSEGKSESKTEGKGEPKKAA